MKNKELETNLKKDCPIKERSLDPIVKVDRLAYMRYGRKDLSKAIDFFQDFGLILDVKSEDIAYLRSIEQASHVLILQESDDEFFTTGFTVDSYQQLERLAEKMQAKIQRRSCALGGSYIQIQDPENNTVEVNYDLNKLSELPHYQASVESNTPTQKPRLNNVVRPKFGPPPIARLGHTVLGVGNIKQAIHWYQDTLGLIVSDFQMLEGQPLPTVGFLRCDQGTTPSDHHTLAIGSAIDLGHLHTAFEVADIDLIAMGQKWLKSKKHTHSWGIGRHILGSQIFDYWRDPWGFQFEHYCDGDMFDASVTTGYGIFNSQSIHQWGPEITTDMLGNKMGPSLLVRVIKLLFAKNDLTFKRLTTLIKST